MLWQSTARTDKGKVRKRNEDAVLDLPERGLWVVADGMGGHQNGALASRLIIEEMLELPDQLSLDERLLGVRDCLYRVNRLLGHDITVTADRPDSIMGSTVVMLLAEGERAICVWAGDSRCYLWRSGRLFQLSRDHCLMQELMEEQQMSEEEAASHPSARALTRAVGANDELMLDVVDFTVYPGDTLLLCSDGLYQDLSRTAIGDALALDSTEHAVQRLFKEALEGPARDNISAVVVRP
ncbi:serine/threonine-protein phosphatase [Halopseudomonas laoshanensis]|uniref:Serine/threonine-protein phosphatase n=2 Tax=Halopseudomonas TaxID=2901189 RepID=A0A7V7GX70_9GAMM|nr:MULTISPECIES: PP2C family serine/threonine-protein phosphatase [Halopseudomonas]KAA0697029.1 serine/threonine-protein phosphatase [Halopseudomonas laoshanensis]MBQ0777521.1 serine/threonine-protein phosphatase [Pseudomonas sp.]PCC98746.1 protein phosphatase [Halopseudomonas pelagia]QFY58781.1 serine/threonine-protein phosphatase [Halopseudomonas pelagia]